ncbi:hypothetical protein SEA_STEVIEBAY_77 [Arthrobacter phage StevieBAY]|uniref:Uncharacterized protein n=1 Tax=Arthrobacter phage StevieBAY TaxID=2725609 RepID=A0A6M3T572_9CAUD|nr:hypothetical protein SEA_STEVIEBAY_77 [Arthrobacter phage StevieBAY]
MFKRFEQAKRREQEMKMNEQQMIEAIRANIEEDFTVRDSYTDELGRVWILTERPHVELWLHFDGKDLLKCWELWEIKEEARTTPREATLQQIERTIAASSSFAHTLTSTGKSITFNGTDGAFAYHVFTTDAEEPLLKTLYVRGWDTRLNGIALTVEHNLDFVIRNF